MGCPPKAYGLTHLPRFEIRVFFSKDEAMETPELATVDSISPLPLHCPLTLVLPRCNPFHPPYPPTPNPPTPPSHHLLLTTVRFVQPGSKRGIRRDGMRKDNAVCFTLRIGVQATGRWHRLAWAMGQSILTPASHSAGPLPVSLATATQRNGHGDGEGERGEGEGRWREIAVSYTHLTLPT